MLHSSKISKKSKIFPTNIKQRLIPIAILSGLLVLTYIAASYFSKPTSSEQGTRNNNQRLGIISIQNRL